MNTNTELIIENVSNPNYTNKPNSIIKSNEIKKPKSINESKELFDIVENFLTKTNVFDVCIDDDEVKFTSCGEIIPNDKILKYKPNESHEEIGKIIASLISKYHYGFESKYACLDKETGNPILYVFLLPVISDDNHYLIKVGYAKNLLKRYSELKREFGINTLYLVYACKIDGEHIELNLHKELKKIFSTSIFKMKKGSSNIISEETYKFSYVLFLNIINIIYRTYIITTKSYLLIKQIALEEKKIKQLELKDILLKSKSVIAEFENQVKIKQLELALTESTNQVKLKELALAESTNQVKLKEIALSELDSQNKLKIASYQLVESNNKVKLGQLDIKAQQIELDKLNAQIRLLEIKNK
jgi:hypothetical protein